MSVFIFRGFVFVSSNSSSLNFFIFVIRVLGGNRLSSFRIYLVGVDREGWSLWNFLLIRAC